MAGTLRPIGKENSRRSEGELEIVTIRDNWERVCGEAELNQVDKNDL